VGNKANGRHDHGDKAHVNGDLCALKKKRMLRTNCGKECDGLINAKIYQANGKRTNRVLEFKASLVTAELAIQQPRLLNKKS
jgi:hypothetical protein